MSVPATTSTSFAVTGAPAITGQSRGDESAAISGFLDDAISSLNRNPADALNGVFLALNELRAGSGGNEWQRQIKLIRQHPVREIVHQDPFTLRAFAKPRGYAGDAVMLDYIYGREERWSPPSMTDIGRTVFDFTTSSPASLGVLARRGYIADMLDLLVNQVRQPRVLAVASGHLREAEITAAFRRQKFGRFVALDGDPESVQETDRCYGRFGVESVHAKIARLFTGRMSLGEFDLIYSTGLFDYLDAPIAKRLINVLFSMLSSGGRLVIGNFMPSIRDAGYMEALMDWKLIYRTRGDMMNITMDLDQRHLSDIHICTEENQNIIFMELTRK